MSDKPTIITLGSISKQEVIKTLELNIMPNTLVMEIMEPFPGYHGANLPTDPVPRSIFMATVREYPDEHLFRITEQINNTFGENYSATPSRVSIYNESYPAIRIWGLESYDAVPQIQERFKDEGIEFRKKKNIKDVALINIKKSFYIEEIAEGVYKDLDTPKMFYFQIPYISWNLFEEITKHIKNNLDNKNVDLALGMFFMHKVVDVVRIYGREVGVDFLKTLRNKYLHEIEMFFA
jgi:hypothetical protein